MLLRSIYVYYHQEKVLSRDYDGKCNDKYDTLSKTVLMVLASELITLTPIDGIGTVFQSA